MRFEWFELKVVLFAGLTALTVFALIVVVVRADDGEAYLDVASCSLLAPGEPVECGKVCRSVSVAPFSERVDAASDAPPAAPPHQIRREP